MRCVGKSGTATQNVLAAYDFDMNFTYVSTGQPGAMHATSVLYHAIRVDKDFFLHPSQGNMVMSMHENIFTYVNVTK